MGPIWRNLTSNTQLQVLAEVCFFATQWSAQLSDYWEAMGSNPATAHSPFRFTWFITTTFVEEWAALFEEWGNEQYLGNCYMGNQVINMNKYS